MTGDRTSNTGSEIRYRKLVPRSPEVRSGAAGCDFRRYRKSHPPTYSRDLLNNRLRGSWRRWRVAAPQGRLKMFTRGAAVFGHDRRQPVGCCGACPCSAPSFRLMPKAMKLWDLTRALQRQGCEVKADTGRHTKWICPCGEHSANIPRHRVISPGVVKNTIGRLACLPEGWLQ